MKSIVKYQGSKRKELPLIKQYITNKYKRIVEPFCGGASVSFGMQLPAVLYDINPDVINLYQVVADKQLYPKLQLRVNEIKEYQYAKLEELFYEARDVINSNNEDPYNRALSYILIRQLGFSGMERYNSSGDFNVPFGHYKRFACNLSPAHHRFLSNCIIKNTSALDCFDEIRENDFVFLDPPYINRLGYITGDGGQELHEQLSEKVKQCKADWLIVHCDDEFYREAYKDYNIRTEAYCYAQCWGKDKNHSNQKVNHLYISNIDF